MELSRFTDYSLRALVYVGLHRESLATIAGIAEAYDISRSHVVKVVQRLVQHGLLLSHRGRGGGLELGQDPADIRVGDVVRATESLALVECLGRSPSACRIDGTCELKRALRQARESFLATLDGYTLADLLSPTRKLHRALGLAAGA